jgi:hypothetical protein
VLVIVFGGRLALHTTGWGGEKVNFVHWTNGHLMRPGLMQDIRVLKRTEYDGKTMKLKIDKGKLHSRISIILLLAAIVDFIMFIVPFYQHLENQRILNEGFRATGIVVVAGNDDTPTGYTFTTYDDKLITGSSWKTNHLRVENYVEIAYDPSNPSSNLPVAFGLDSLWYIVFYALVFVPFGIFTLAYWTTFITTGGNKFFVWLRNK